jgi:hypothetical protein
MAPSKLALVSNRPHFAELAADVLPLLSPTNWAVAP